MTVLKATAALLALMFGLTTPQAACVDLLPIEPEVGSRDDALALRGRAWDSASVEVRSPDWRPWRLILGLRDGETSIRLAGAPIHYAVSRTGDTVFFRLSPAPTVRAPIDLPNTSFHLYALLGNEYTHGFVSIYPDDSLDVEVIQDSGLLEFRCERKLPPDVVLVQLNGEASRTARAVEKRLRGVAALTVLDPGYYSNLTAEIMKSRRGGRGTQHNYTANGRVMALRVLQPTDQNSWRKIETVIEELNREGKSEDGVVLVSK